MEIIFLSRFILLLIIPAYLFVAPLVHFFTAQNARAYFFLAATVFAIPACICAIAGVDTLMVEKASSNIIFGFLFYVVAPIATILSLIFNNAGQKGNARHYARNVNLASLLSLGLAILCVLIIAAANGQFK
jgi:hypothetical protein